jgi:EmrB/QacA subfamily drug resistance transporter
MRMQHAGAVLELRAVPRLKARHRAWAFSAIAVGTFLTSLDGSSTATILPIIGRAFGSPIGTVEWVLTANLLVVSACLLAVGWLADARGHERVYVGGLVVFVVGSTLCAASPSIAALVAARVVQAVGSAMVLATSPTLLMRMYPASERAWALGVHVGINYLALTVGPWVGGWLTDWYSWRMAFAVHLPLGFIACAMSVSWLQPIASGCRQRRFDVGGATCFSGALTVLLLALNHVRHQSVSAAAIGMFAVAALALLVFAAVESRAQQPLLDLRLFTLPPFTIAVSALVFAYVCLQAVTFALPFYLIHTRGLTVVGAALLMSIRPAVTACVAPIGGRVGRRVHAAVIGAIGIGALCAGAVLIARVDAAASLAQVAAGLAMMALGMGLLLPQAQSALFSAAQIPNQGVAAGVMNTARTIGMALGVGLGRIVVLGS